MKLKQKFLAVVMAVLLLGGTATTLAVLPQSGIGVTASAAETGTLYTVTAWDFLALRSKDSTSGKLLKKIPKGTVVSVTRFNKKKTWGYTSFKGTSGWICLQAYAKKYTAAPVANGTYGILTQLNTKKGLVVHGASKSNKANVFLWSFAANDKNRQFKIEKYSGQWYRIINMNSGKVLDVANGKDAKGTNVQQYTWNKSNAQLWRFIPAGNGYYYIQSKTGLYLDVAGGKTADRTNIQIWTPNGSKSQKFLLKKITTTVAVSSIKLNKTSASVTAGGSVSLTATVSPSNATNKSVSWSSSNNNVATVSGGKVTGKKAGTATITAKSSNGKTATCKVTVKKAVANKSSTSNASVKARLDSLIKKWNGKYWTTNGKKCSVNHQYSSKIGTCKKWGGAWQCKSFASWAFNELFKGGNIGPYDSTIYNIKNPRNAYLVKQIKKATTTAKVKSMLASAKPGDFFQVRREAGYGHSMIIVSVNKDSITVFDCNSDFRCGIKKHNVTYSNLASRNNGFSIYRAKNYK